MLNLTLEDDPINNLSPRGIFLPGMSQKRCLLSQLCLDPIFFLMWDILIILVFSVGFFILHYLENPYGLRTLFSHLFRVTILKGLMMDGYFFIQG